MLIATNLASLLAFSRSASTGCGLPLNPRAFGCKLCAESPRSAGDIAVFFACRLPGASRLPALLPRKSLRKRKSASLLCGGLRVIVAHFIEQLSLVLARSSARQLTRECDRFPSPRRCPFYRERWRTPSRSARCPSPRLAHRISATQQSAASRRTCSGSHNPAHHSAGSPQCRPGISPARGRTSALLCPAMAALPPVPVAAQLPPAGATLTCCPSLR
jgi:hypothetical protein